MQLQEGLAEACGEGGGGLGDAPLGAGQLGGEAGEEVILGLLRSQDGHRRQHTKGISGQEDHILGSRRRRNGTDNVVNMINGIADAGILGDGLVAEVDLAVGVHGNVLQQSIPADGVVDVRLGFLVQVDDLGIAAALEVKDTVIVPAVLIIADKQALGVGGQGGLAGAGQAEEDGGILAVHVGVGRAVHGGNALEGQVVVHHGEHTLLHLAAVPGIDDNLLPGGNVEGHTGLGIEAQLLIVFYLGLGGVVHHKVRLKALQLLLGGLDEHILNKVCLPGHLHDEAHGHTSVLVGAAEGVHHEQALVAQLADSQLLHLGPHILAHRMVIVFISLAGPPNGVLGIIVHDNILVLGRAAGVDAGHHVHGAQLGDLPDLVACQLRLGLLCEQSLIGRVVDDLGGAGNTVLTQINGHSDYSFSCKLIWKSFKINILPLFHHPHYSTDKQKMLLFISTIFSYIFSYPNKKYVCRIT